MLPLAGVEAPPVTEDVFFRAGSHLLHGELSYPDNGQTSGAVVIAGPHPLLGGNLRNNVVLGLGDGLAQNGMLTLRFDYRGVGRSQGPPVDVARHLAAFWQTSHAPGEMDFWQDVQAATEFARQCAPGLSVALIGYSFGCALLPYVQPQENLAALVLIAPTIAKHNYDSFLSVTRRMLVVASEDDFATDAAQVEDWFGSLTMPRQLVRQQCDNHFFRGHEDWLTKTVFTFLGSHRGDDA